MASDTLVIKMPARFDYSSSVDFNAAIAQALAQAELIRLDCSDMNYIDSAGIGLLVMSHKKAQEKSVSLVMGNLKAAPREILELANMQKLITIE